MQALLPTVRAIDLGRIIQFLIYAGKGRKIDDGVPAKRLPKLCQNVDRQEVGRVI